MRQHRNEYILKLCKKALERPNLYTPSNFIDLLDCCKKLDFNENLNLNQTNLNINETISTKNEVTKTITNEPTKVTNELVQTLVPSTGKLNLDEAIHLFELYTNSLPDPIKFNFKKLPENILHHIYNVMNSKKSMSLSGDVFVSLLESMGKTAYKHPRMLELLTVRSAKMLRSAQFGKNEDGVMNPIGLRALTAFSQHQDFAARFRAVLHRKSSVAKIVQQVLSFELSPRKLAERNTGDLDFFNDFDNYLNIGILALKLGFFSDELFAVRSRILRDEINYKYLTSNMIEKLGLKIWFLLEMFHDEECKKFCGEMIDKVVESLGNNSKGINIDGDSGEKLMDGLFKMAWGSAALGKDDCCLGFFDLIWKFSFVENDTNSSANNIQKDSKNKKNTSPTQVIKFTTIDPKIAQQAAITATLHPKKSLHTQQIIEIVTKLPRPDLFFYLAQEKGTKGAVPLKEQTSDQWVSQALNKMSLNHGASVVLPTPLESYRVCATFPIKKVLVNCYEFTDIFAYYNEEGLCKEPRLSMSGILRKKHMELCGWKVADVIVTQLYMARRGMEGGIVSCLARRLSGYLDGLEGFICDDDEGRDSDVEDGGGENEGFVEGGEE